MTLIHHLRNVVAGERAINVHGAVCERRIRRVRLKGQSATNATMIETGEAEATLGEGGTVIFVNSGPEGAVDAESAIRVKDGRTVEHPFTEVADNPGTIAE